MKEKSYAEIVADAKNLIDKINKKKNIATGAYFVIFDIWENGFYAVDSCRTTYTKNIRMAKFFEKKKNTKWYFEARAKRPATAVVLKVVIKETVEFKLEQIKEN